MVLSDGQIKARLAQGDLAFVGLLDVDDQVQPASVDLRLGGEVRRFTPSQHPLLPDNADTAHSAEYHAPGETFTIHPGEFLLACTWESLWVPDDLVLEVSGRSSIGRRGLFVENAGFIDPGFAGQITLELYNARPQPLVLRVGQKICQVKISQLGEPAERPYGHSSRRSKYLGQCGATASHLDYDPPAAELFAAWEAQKALRRLGQ